MGVIYLINNKRKILKTMSSFLKKKPVKDQLFFKSDKLKSIDFTKLY